MSGPEDDKQLEELERRFHEGRSAVRTGAVDPALGDGPVDPALGDDAGDPALGDDEDLSRTVLARRLARRRGHGLPARERKVPLLLSSWTLGALAALSIWSLVGLLPELRYFASRAAPIDLGHLGAYHPEEVPDGAYVHVEGIASPRRGTWSRLFAEHELFPLIASRILVDRRGAPDPSLRGYGFPYRGEGRLSRVPKGSRWDGVRTQFVDAGELARDGDIYLIEDGLVPGHGLRTPLEALGWTALCATCIAFLARRLRARRPAHPLAASSTEG